MSNKKKKIQAAKISIFITSVFVIFLSVTYAFVNLTLTGTKRQVITAGNLQLVLEEDDPINITSAFPMDDEVGMIGPTYNFRLINKNDVSIDYVLKLKDVTKSDNKLATNIVKYGLEKEGTRVGIHLLSEIEPNEYTLEENKISGGETLHFSLRL